MERRKSDKTITANLVFSISSFIVLLVFSYVIMSINGRIDRIETKQDKFIQYYIECKQDIADLRQQYIEDLEKIKDKLIAWLKRDEQRKK